MDCQSKMWNSHEIGCFIGHFMLNLWEAHIFFYWYFHGIVKCAIKCGILEYHTQSFWLMYFMDLVFIAQNLTIALLTFSQLTITSSSIPKSGIRTRELKWAKERERERDWEIKRGRKRCNWHKGHYRVRPDLGSGQKSHCQIDLWAKYYMPRLSGHSIAQLINVNVNMNSEHWLLIEFLRANFLFSAAHLIKFYEA